MANEEATMTFDLLVDQQQQAIIAYNRERLARENTLHTPGKGMSQAEIEYRTRSERFESGRGAFAAPGNGQWGEPFTYEVKQGDTLWNLANHFCTSVEDICALNSEKGLTRSSVICAGDKLKLRAPDFVEIITPRTSPYNGLTNSAFETASHFTRFHASKWRVPYEDMLEPGNRHLKDMTEETAPKDVIPVCKGLMHLVQPDETVDSICAKYRSKPAATCDLPCCRTIQVSEFLRTNPQLQHGRPLEAGQKVYIREFFFKIPFTERDHPDPSQRYVIN